MFNEILKKNLQFILYHTFFFKYTKLVFRNENVEFNKTI